MTNFVVPDAPRTLSEKPFPVDPKAPQKFGTDIFGNWRGIPAVGPDTVYTSKRSADADEIKRLNMATDETLGASEAYAFQHSATGRYAAYLLRRWREIALK